MAWHHLFRGDDDPNELRMYWIDSALHQIVCDHIAEYLDHVATENRAGRIPYSIRYCGQQMDESGRYVPRSIGDGLSCTSYIIDVLDACELPLVQVESWPTGRADDRALGRELIEALRASKPPASPEHIAAQEEAIDNLIRFRPEEVAAAFALYPMLSEYLEGPLSFHEVERESVLILRLLT